MIAQGVLDLSPISPPRLAKGVVGGKVEFAEICRRALIPNVVSSGARPIITIHAGEVDLKVPSPGRMSYCIAGATLPPTEPARSREVLRRLAYGYLDWAAREVVGRYHRDLRRPVQARTERRTGLPSSVVLRRVLRANPGATIGMLSEITGMAQPNVSRTIASMAEAGEVEIEKLGRHTRCSLLTTNEVEGPTLNP